MTPGPFVIYPTGGSKRPYYNTHEPGHVVQFYLMGPALYTIGVIIKAIKLYILQSTASVLLVVGTLE